MRVLSSCSEVLREIAKSSLCQDRMTLTLNLAPEVTHRGATKVTQVHVVHQVPMPVHHHGHRTVQATVR